MTAKYLGKEPMEILRRESNIFDGRAEVWRADEYRTAVRLYHKIIRKGAGKK